MKFLIDYIEQEGNIFSVTQLSMQFPFNSFGSCTFNSRITRLKMYISGIKYAKPNV